MSIRKREDESSKDQTVGLKCKGLANQHLSMNNDPVSISIYVFLFENNKLDNETMMKFYFDAK